MLSASAQEFLRNHQGKKLVFTNGCFDLIHAGHVSYLGKAKELGDLLFVGLNSDASVTRLKGNRRPINNQNDRKFVLRGLRAVDFVEIFDEDTPLDLIKSVNPSVLVKGGDWKVDDIVGHDFVQENGGTVLGLNFEPGHSTTNLIEKIRNLP